MARKRRSFSGAFKAKVALAGVPWRQDHGSAWPLSYEVHVGQITAGRSSSWRSAGAVRRRPRQAARLRTRPMTKELYEQIGRLKMEVRVVEKKSCRAHLKD